MVKGVHNALAPILAMSRAFGATVMSARGRNYVFSSKLYSYFLALFIGAMIEGIMESFQLSAVHSISVVLGIEIFVFCFFIFTALIVLYQHYHFRDTFPAIITELEVMDKLIGNVQYNIYYNYAVIFLSVINGFPKIFILLNRPFSWNNLLTRALYFSFSVTPVLIAGQYAVLIHILSRQLHTLSEHLDKAIFNVEVLSLIDVHHNLVLLADMINRAFNIFLIHIITFIFVINTMRLYFVIVYFVKPDSYTNIEVMMFSVFEFLFNYGCLILVVTAAMEATTKAENFNKLLLKKFLNSETIANNDQIRTYLGMKHKIQQNACKFFSLDYHLITSMAAGTTTYVILLVQFTLL